MYRRTYHAPHRDSMAGARNDDPRDRYLIADLFAAVEPGLKHSLIRAMGENIDYTDMDVLDVNQLK